MLGRAVSRQLRCAGTESEPSPSQTRHSNPCRPAFLDRAFRQDSGTSGKGEQLNHSTNFWLLTVNNARSWLGTRMRGGRVLFRDLFKLCPSSAGLQLDPEGSMLWMYSAWKLEPNAAANIEPLRSDPLVRGVMPAPRNIGTPR